MERAGFSRLTRRVRRVSSPGFPDRTPLSESIAKGSRQGSQPSAPRRLKSAARFVSKVATSASSSTAFSADGVLVHDSSSFCSVEELWLFDFDPSFVPDSFEESSELESSCSSWPSDSSDGERFDVVSVSIAEEQASSVRASDQQTKPPPAPGSSWISFKGSLLNEGLSLFPSVTLRPLFKRASESPKD